MPSRDVEIILTIKEQPPAPLFNVTVETVETAVERVNFKVPRVLRETA